MCSFLVSKKACLNYREFDLEGDLVGVPHTWYLSAQSFIRLLKLLLGKLATRVLPMSMTSVNLKVADLKVLLTQLSF